MVRMRDAPGMFGISISSLYRLEKDGRIRCVKHGRRTLVDVESVRGYLATLPSIGSGSPG